LSRHYRHAAAQTEIALPTGCPNAHVGTFN
jgi:hypothetical protein